MVAEMIRPVCNVRKQPLHETISGPKTNVCVTVTFYRSSGSISDSEFRWHSRWLIMQSAEGHHVNRCTTIAYPGLVSYLPSRLLFTRTITALACLFGVEAEAWAVPSSWSSSLAPTSLATAITGSSFDVGHTSAACPHPLHPQHSFTVQLATLWPFLPHLGTSLRRYHI